MTSPDITMYAVIYGGTFWIAVGLLELWYRRPRKPQHQLAFMRKVCAVIVALIIAALISTWYTMATLTL